MKIIFTLLFTISVTLLYAQDTLYYDAEYNKVSKDSVFAFYKITSFNKELNKYLRETYSSKHVLESQSYYKDAKCDTLDGEFKEYFKNSNKLKVKGNNTNNNYNGELTTYWENGNLRRRDIFKGGEFKEGICYDSNAVEIPHYDFETMPIYSRGDKKLLRDIIKNLKYPSKARKNNIEGRVMTSFVINKEGKVERIKIVTSVHPLLDDAAIETLKKFSEKALFIPAYKEMEPVNVRYNIPLNFKIVD